MIAQRGMGHGPRTLALRASQGRVCRESQLDERSLSWSLRRDRDRDEKRQRQRQRRDRHEKRDRDRDGDEEKIP